MKICRKRLGSVKEIKSEEGVCAAAKASSSDDDWDYCYSVMTKQFVGAIGKKAPKATITLNKVKCNLLVDTSASVNILDEKTYQRIGSPKLH